MAAPSRGAKWRRRTAPAVPGLIALALIFALQLLAPGPVDRIGLSIFDAYQRAAPRAVRGRAGPHPRHRRRIDPAAGAMAVAAGPSGGDDAEAGGGRRGGDRLRHRLFRTRPDRARRGWRRRSAIRRRARCCARLPDPDNTLASAFGQTPVVLGYFLTHDGKAQAVPPKAGFAVTGTPPDNLPTFSNAIVPLPGLDAAATGTGFVSTVGDADGIVRRAPLIAKQGEQLLPSLSLEALRVAQQAGSITVKSSDASGESGGDGGDVVSIKAGQFEIPTTHAGELWLRFTAPQPARAIPAWKLMQDKLTPAELEAALRRADRVHRRRRDRAARSGRDPDRGTRAGRHRPRAGGRAGHPRQVPGAARLGARAGARAAGGRRVGARIRPAMDRRGDRRGHRAGRGRRHGGRQLVGVQGARFPDRPDLAIAWA